MSYIQWCPQHIDLIGIWTVLKFLKPASVDHRPILQKQLLHLYELRRGTDRREPQYEVFCTGVETTFV